jgi:hypothetical protein
MVKLAGGLRRPRRRTFTGESMFHYGTREGGADGPRRLDADNCRCSTCGGARIISLARRGRVRAGSTSRAADALTVFWQKVGL